jgi:hypothetical protein
MKLGPLLPLARNSKAIYIDGWQTKKEEELEALVAKNNGGNVGLRLDRYVSLDPDSAAARNLAEQWEREGIIPPTVAWKTASGAVRRLFLAPPGLSRMQIQEINFDLRHGPGFQDVIPPSYVIDPDKGIDGPYTWLPDQDPDSIEVAPLPTYILEYFKKHSSTCSSNKASNTNICKTDARTVSLVKGERDEDLFHIANTLFRGGMGYENVSLIIEHLARCCDPPFNENDARKKVESAQKRAQKTGGETITAQVREWVSVTPGDFSVTFCYSDLGFVTSCDKATARKALQRMVEEGLIINITGKKGMYRPVMKEMTRIKLSEANTQGTEIDIKYPFQLENWYKTFPKTVIIIAGVTDAGKTAFLLDFVAKNIGFSPLPINYFTSEMGIDEFFERASNIPGFDADYWDKHLTIWERSDTFEDVINPEAINIIDNLDLHDEFYKVAGIIHRIWSKLKKGIAIIALHKDKAKDWGKGGQGSAERARLYLSLEPGDFKRDIPNTMKVLKIKNWRNRLQNIKGKEFKFKLINGCSFMELEY